MLIEKSINSFRFFHFIEMLSKSFFKFMKSALKFGLLEPCSKRAVFTKIMHIVAI